MTQTKERRQPVTASEAPLINDSAFKTQSPQTIPRRKAPGKLDRMLSIFAAGRSLNTFEAQGLADTCLHTTVSSLQIRHLLTFRRKWEKVRNRYGTDTNVCRYWLEGDQLERAAAIVSGNSGRAQQ